MLFFKDDPEAQPRGKRNAEFFFRSPGLSAGAKENAESQTCTGDAGLFRPALYYLSYLGLIFFK